METLNQSKAAKFLDISEGYLSKILSGKSIPRPAIIKNLSKMTNSTASLWLFGKRADKERAIKKAISQKKTIKIKDHIQTNINSSHKLRGQKNNG